MRSSQRGNAADPLAFSEEEEEEDEDDQPAAVMSIVSSSPLGRMHVSDFPVIEKKPPTGGSTSQTLDESENLNSESEEGPGELFNKSEDNLRNDSKR